MNAQQAFKAALGHLQVEMPKSTYDTWVRDTQFVAHEDGDFVIGAPSAYARDWLESRLRSTITRMLTGMMNRTVEVRFVVWQTAVPTEEAAPAENDGAPTFQSRAEEIGRAQEGFAKLVQWPGNQIAVAAGRKVAENLGNLYNPLVLYGEPGVGKSAILKAIAQLAKAHGANVVVISAEEFTNAFLDALRHKTMEEFRQGYRHVDMLLVDDLHFLMGKGKTLEEFLSTFNALYNAGKQIVIASNKRPRDMELETALTSRLEGGLLAEVEVPSFEARLSILQQIVDGSGLEMEPWVLEQIASAITHDIRPLTGALTRVMAKVRVMGTSLENGGLEEILSAYVSDQREGDPEATIAMVAKEFGVTTEGLLSDKRDQPIATARQVAMYLLWEHGGMSLVEIGSMLGRDHSTVKHGVKRIEEELASENSAITPKVRALEMKVYGRVPAEVASR